LLASFLPSLYLWGECFTAKLSSPSMLLSLFFLRLWGLDSGPHLESLHQPFFCNGFFADGVSGTIYPGWLQTAWVARITGVSHWCLANLITFFLS
jgi:hypothetical protein